MNIVNWHRERTKGRHVDGILENFTKVMPKAFLVFFGSPSDKVEHLHCDQY